MHNRHGLTDYVKSKCETCPKQRTKYARQTIGARRFSEIHFSSTFSHLSIHSLTNRKREAAAYFVRLVRAIVSKESHTLSTSRPKCLRKSKCKMRSLVSTCSQGGRAQARKVRLTCSQNKMYKINCATAGDGNSFAQTTNRTCVKKSKGVRF